MDSDDDILAKEIESWTGYEYALCQQNAKIFSKMLSECLDNEEYAAAFKTKGSQYSSESLFIALIFQQQKTISRLMQQIRSNATD